MTKLLGRRATGKYVGKNPNYNKDAPQYSPERAIDAYLPTEGEVVAVYNSGTDLYITILDAECRLRVCHSKRVVILPHDHAGPLR